MRFLSRFAYAAVICLLLAGIVSCSHGTGNSPSAPTNSSGELTEGYFIDAPSAGLYYKAYPSGLCGYTGRSGNFNYRRGDTITFYVGSHQIGYSVTASRCISPLTIAHATTIYGYQNEARLAQNIIRFFMAMNTGLNPYGIMFPSTFGSWNGNLMNILCSPSFDTEIVNVVASLREIIPSEVVVPSIETAQNHFLVSESLINQVENNAAKNLYVSMKLPSAFRNRYVDIAYNADQYPDGSNQYNSGMKVLVNNSGNANFSTILHEANWQLTLTAMQNNSKMSINDVITFYSENGFSATPSAEYKLAITDEKELLHADLTNRHNTGVVSNVHTLSGTITVPKIFDDATTLTDSSLLELKLFADILDSEGNRAGSVMLMLPVPEAETWTESENSWTLPYTTSLADGYDYKIQLYWRPDSSKAYFVKETQALDAAFTEDVTDVNFSFDSWMDM